MPHRRDPAASHPREPGDSDAAWQEIVTRASNLTERLAAFKRNQQGRDVSGTTARPDSADSDLQRLWRLRVANGDDEKFRLRLRFLGVDASDIPDCLVPTPPPDTQLPEWCRVLQRVAWSGADASESDRPLSAERYVASAAELLPAITGPLVVEGLAALVQRHPELAGDSDEMLATDLAQSLQRNLAELMQTCVAAELNRTRLDPQRVAAMGERAEYNLWDDWMAEQRDTGLIELWRRFPVLARLVGTAILLWVDRSDELLNRAKADAELIGRFVGLEGVTLARARPGLSDPHCGHASVVECVFSDSNGVTTRLMYKPKDLTTEVVFADLVRWMNSHGADLGRSLNVLAVDGYGWTEHVVNQPVAEGVEASTYFRRCGVLTSMLFAIGGTDCVAENLVACGDRPVVIDAETLLQPSLQQVGVGARATPRDESVLDTLLPPRWISVRGNAIDVSALSVAGQSSQPTTTALRWVDAGASAAHLALTSEPGLQRNSDVRTASGARVTVDDHAASYLEGFEQGWSIFSGNASEAFAPDGPLAQLPNASVRVVVRMTAMYGRLLQSSLSPNLMTDGLDRSLHFERLARVALNRRDAQEYLRVVDAEARQLEVGDVPLFAAPGGADAITDADGDRILAFAETATDRARRRASNLTDGELERQLVQLRCAIAVASPRIRTETLAAQVDAQVAGHVPGQPRQRVTALTEACRVVTNQILEAVDAASTDGQIVGLTAISDDQWGIGPLDSTLAIGTTGLAVALFASSRALAGVAPADAARARDLASAVLQPSIIDTIERFDAIAHQRGIGANTGLGGVLAGLATCHGLSTSTTAQEFLISAMDQLTSRLKPDWLLQSHPLGVSNGYLGLITGLRTAASAGATVSPELIDVIRAAVADQHDLDLADSLAAAHAVRQSVTAEVSQAVTNSPVEFVSDIYYVGQSGYAQLLAMDGADDLRAVIDAVVPGRQSKTPSARSTRDDVLGGLASRACERQLRLGVPESCPLPHLGLNRGIAGVLYTLAEAATGDALPSFVSRQMPD